MVNGIVSVHAGIYGMGIYAIMLPSSGFSVAYSMQTSLGPWRSCKYVTCRVQINHPLKKSISRLDKYN